MRVLIFSFVLSSCYCLESRFPRSQTAGVRGKLLCNNKPLARAVMLLCKGYFSKTMLDVAATDKNGFFKISGTAIELSAMNPQLRIYSFCNRKSDGLNPKMKEVCIGIPPKFISNGKKVKKYWDVEIELGTEANLCSHPSAQ